MTSWESSEPQRAPQLTIPDSTQTVRVSVIDSTTRIGNFPVSRFMGPKVGCYDTLNCPAFSFLIENENKGQKVLFDLGVRKDWQNLAKPLIDMISDTGATLKIEKNVSEIIQDNGVRLESINAIIWSHRHFDHQGDPSLFPPSTALVVGPRFKELQLPGYPTDPNATVNESSFEGRELREVSPESDSSGLKVGPFSAMDYFDDGSFYLLFAPGHTHEHLCGLARTTTNPTTFIFMSADAVHHVGEHRPTAYLPLPKEIQPSPLLPMPRAVSTVCPGDMFYKLHPVPSATEPFMKATSGDDLEQCHQTVDRLKLFDAQENILCIMAHDASMLDVLELYPRPANDWKAKGWRENHMWRFLSDFVEQKT